MTNFLRKNKILFISIIAVIVVVVMTISIALIAKETSLNKIQEDALHELTINKGNYDEQSIILYDTNRIEAEEFAERIGAKLRITKDGSFATLILPIGVTIDDVYADKNNREILEKFTADYKVRTNDITDEDIVKERIVSKPEYSVFDTDYSSQTYLDYLNMKNVWASYTGTGITVAVIDTGIDTDHPEFNDKISEYSYNASEDKIVKDYDISVIEDEQGHGTAVAGVIASQFDGIGIVGIAPNVTLIVIKCECDENGNFKRTSDLVFGLYYAIERDVDIVNMSFGTKGLLNPFAKPTQLAIDSDIICVAAAGNDSTAELSWPASDPNVIGVGALEENGWVLADYSNYGENVNVVAPGTVYTCALGGGYTIMNGTSFASPITAGVIALYLEQNRYQEFSNVCEMLYASCYDLGSLGEDYYFGYGAVDVSALLLEERGTITFNYLTDEIETTTQVFIRNHTLQNIPEPERLYAVFDGWYYDEQCTDEYNWYSDVWTSDLTLYASWVNEDDGLPYIYVELDDGTIEIREYTGHRRYITIPDYIDEKLVTSIGEKAFLGESRLREVILPRYLKQIKRSAFENCNNLLGIEIPDSVTYIGKNAFSGNVRLSYVSFTDNSELRVIDSYAFSGCSRLQRFEVGKKVEQIDGSVFFGDTWLTQISVKKGNENYTSSNGVLFNKTGSTIVAYPAGKTGEYVVPNIVRAIGNYAFGYAKITSIDFNNVQTIGDSAFSYSQLTNVEIKDSILDIGKGSFEYTTSLKILTIGHGINVIPENTFNFTLSLSEVEIPNTILQIKSGAFSSSNLSKVTFEDESTLAIIGEDAFLCTNLKSIVIPKSVISIGSQAFKFNLGLSSVIFEDDSSLRKIGEQAFANTSKLNTITLPSKLETIGDYCFKDSGLSSSVNIPKSVTYYGAGAFASCHSLQNIYVDDENEIYVDIDGVVYTKDEKTIIEYPAGNGRNEYTIQAGTETVYDSAFYGSYNLNYVYLPETLTYIQRSGFYDVKMLQSISIPDNVYQISNYAFANDWNMHYVYFGEGSKLPRISYGAFAYCGVYNFRVPSNVSTITQGAFEGCKYLTSFTFASNSKLESISAYMFDGCDNLTSITFENGSKLTSIQAHGLEGMIRLQYVNFGDAKITNIDNYAFRFDESLQDITLTNGLTYIGRYAFFGCKSLTSILIPSTVEYIGRYAFYYDNNLDIYFASDNLPLYLQENWDEGIRGYYIGVSNIVDDGDWTYAVLNSGNISIVEYRGAETIVDLNDLNYGTIVTIGGSSFSYGNVEKIILPDTVTNISSRAFAYSGLKEIDIPNSVSFIGREAFLGTKLEILILCYGVKVIEQRAFADTKELTSVVLPKSITTLGSGVFQGSGLTSVTFENGIELEEIPQNCFYDTKLTSVVIPNSVKTINHSAFREIEELTSVTFNETQELRLGSNVFYHSGLTSLYIPKNMVYIGEYAFVGLRELNNITVDAENPNYKSIDGLLASKDGRKLIVVPAGREGVLEVPAGIEILGFGCFEDSKLSRVTFKTDANILTLGYRAFFNADNIEEIVIPASVVSIDYYAFAMCDNLKKVTFAEGTRLSGIYEGAFYLDKNLETIALPSTIVEISDFTFYGCEKIKNIPVENPENLKGIFSYAFAYTGINGEFTTPESLLDIGDYSFKGTKIIKLTIPDTNAKELFIGIGAFEGCNEIEEVTLPFVGRSYEDEEITWFGYIFGAGGFKASKNYVPETIKVVNLISDVQTIGKGAFYGCEYISDIYLPSTIYRFGYNAFTGTQANYELVNPILILDECNTEAQSIRIGDYMGIRSQFGRGPKKINIQNEFVELGEFAFWECSNLEEAILPDTIRVISRNSFESCSNLTTINIPYETQVIDESAFARCYNLYHIELNDKLKEIGRFAFISSGLISIELPDSIQKIREGAFENCFLLTQITLSSSLDTIESYAFCGCEGLLKVINRSNINIEFSSLENGWIGYYVNMIVDRNNNVYTKENGYTLINANDFIYEYNNGKYYLISYVGDKKEIILPLSINDCKYELKEFTYSGKVIIPEGFETIDECAFRNSRINEIEIPESVSIIEGAAFENCENLKNVVIGEGVKSIGIRAFGSCVNLEYVSIPESVEVVECAAFQYCYNLKTIKLSEGLKTIWHYAFNECRNLKSIELPNSLCELKYNAFEGCELLKNITIPNKIEIIEPGVFKNCYSLTHVKIPNSIKTIKIKAFENCESLDVVEIEDVNSWLNIQFTNNGIDDITGTNPLQYANKLICKGEIINEVSIPDDIDSINNALFYGYKGLTKVSINKNVNHISSNAFHNCVNLNEFIIDNENESFVNKDGIIYTKDGTELIFALPNLIGSIEIDPNVNKIDSYAFSGCKHITSIIMPNNVQDIGEWAFYNCSSLEHIHLSDNLMYLPSYVFMNCLSLKEIIMSQSIEQVGVHAFEGCESLESVLFNNNIKKIDSWAFNNCLLLKTITIPESISEIGVEVFNNCRSLTKVDWNSEVDVPNNSFYNCEKLETVNFNSNIKTIGDYAFAYCTSLKEINYPDSINAIGEYAFCNCFNLKEVLITPNLDTISKATYYGCESITTVSIPENIICIEDMAFARCQQLENVTLSSTLEILGNEAFSYCYNLGSILIPKKITTLSNHLFLDCVSLRNVELNNDITSIGYATFRGCYSLTSISLPLSLTLIDEEAFFESGLLEIWLPNKLETINRNAFDYCYNLAIIHNDSSLKFELYSRDNGCVSLNAYKIINSDGSIEGIEDVEYIITIDGFKFLKLNNQYILKEYCGELEEVTLPNSVFEHDYSISRAKGFKTLIYSNNKSSIEDFAFSFCGTLKKVIIPNNIISIGNAAFECCTNLERVEFPENLIYIGSNAFQNCYCLETIHLPDSLEEIYPMAFNNCTKLENVFIGKNIHLIGQFAFGETKFYKNLQSIDPENIIYNKYLLENTQTIKYYIDEMDCIALDAFTNSKYILEYITIKGKQNGVLLSFSNLITVKLMELPDQILSYYYYFPIQLTLRNFILTNECIPKTSNIFEGITGVNIYIDLPKGMAKDLPTGWNNGNKVYYSGEWIEVTFYDEDGNIIVKEPQPIPQIIRQPYIENINNCSTSRVFIGWDIDENGIVDSVPATSSVNIEAHAIMADVDNTYRVTFYDMDRETIVKSYIVNYGEIVEIPEISKTGYTFNGWIGYYEGQEVTSNINAYASFTHEGEGHNYIKTIVNPKCAEKGYDCYECSICHETYKDNYVEPLGHNYGEWIIENQSSCTDEGLRYHICTRCENREEEPTEALGHNYVSHINKAATCEHEGEITYTCSRCNDVKKETIEMSAHHYEKRKASKWFIQVLIEKLLNMFFGYEGNDRYYYVCSECHHVMTIEEYNYTQTASAQESNCTHTSGTWTVVRKPSGHEYGIEILYCDLCGEGIDARYCGEPGGYLEGDIKEDGVVDNHDLFTLFKYLSNVETSVNEKALDINGDGKVNNKDITRLFQFISKYEVEVF